MFWWKNWEKVIQLSWLHENQKVAFLVKKAVKGQGFVKKTLPLHVSNVAYYLADQKKATKIWLEITKEGRKVRKAKVTGKIID